LLHISRTVWVSGWSCIVRRREYMLHPTVTFYRYPEWWSFIGHHQTFKHILEKENPVRKTISQTHRYTISHHKLPKIHKSSYLFYSFFAKAFKNIEERTAMQHLNRNIADKTRESRKRRNILLKKDIRAT